MSNLSEDDSRIIVDILRKHIKGDGKLSFVISTEEEDGSDGNYLSVLTSRPMGPSSRIRILANGIKLESSFMCIMDPDEYNWTEGGLNIFRVNS